MIRANRLASLGFALLVSTASWGAADHFWNTPEAFLGEKPPGDVPRIFAAGRLMEAGLRTMGRVAFSADGREFYYTLNNSWESGEQARVQMIRFEGGAWGKPALVAKQLFSPTLSMDGKTLYLREGGMNNAWRAMREGNAWQPAQAYLRLPFGIYDFMPTLSGNIYVGSEPDAEDRKHGSSYSFSVLTIDERDIKVRSLGRPLNAPTWNGDLFIAPDESYIIVSAKETPTFESELHIAFRKPDHTWTAPVSLGARINDGPAHRWGQYVTADGKYLFYSHGTSAKDCAVHWVRFAELLESLRPKK